MRGRRYAAKSMGSRTRTGAWISAALAFVAIAAVVPAAQAAPTADAAIKRVGRIAAFPRDARVTGQLAPQQLLHVTIALKPRDPAALNAYASAVSTPGSTDYRHYLTPAQFARRFGATAAAVAAVRRDLTAHGLTPGRLSRGGLSLPVYGTAAALQRGFAISLRRVSLRGRTAAVTASAAPAFSAAAAGAVEQVVGLDSLDAPKPLLVRPSAAGQSTRIPLASPHVATGGPQPCGEASSAAAAYSAYTADQIASAYGFSGLYGAGDQGAGVTIAIYELEPYDPADIAAYESCYGIHTHVNAVTVDGGAGKGAGSSESALDIENVIGLAPAANVLVYEGRNSSSGSPGAGPFDTFSSIINQDKAQVVSVSWGECEAQLGSTDAQAENQLFAQAAIQGQTIVSAAGDNGSEDCNGDSAIPQTQLAVDDPASQPYVTGVGGTTLSALGPRPTESVWNDGGGTPSMLVQPGAGGGGISDLWQMPSGQRDAAPSLNVLGAGLTGSQCGDPGGYCREVPDVAADADPATGYLIDWNTSGTVPDAMPGWQAIAGTSGAAPVWAALFALADASHGCTAGPLGDAVPALYRAASTSYAADFNDVQTGNNDFTATNGGHFAAGPGYDEASGLGTPNASALAGTMCSNTLRVTEPPAQQSAQHASVSLRLRYADPQGGPVQFEAVGLPSGLSINARTGRITGTVKRRGNFHVTVGAEDSRGSVGGTRFTWAVGGATRVVAANLTGTGSQQPSLSFTVIAGRSAPPITQLVITAPAQVRFASAQGVALSAPGQHPRYATHLSGSSLIVILHHALTKLSLNVVYPSLRSVGPHANSKGGSSGQLAIKVTDANQGMSRITARVR